MIKFLVKIGLCVALAASPVAASPALPQIDFVDPMSGSGLPSGHDLSPVGMYMAADWVVQAVIIILLVASVITWTIGLMKWLELRGERRRLRRGMRKLLQARNLGDVGDTGYAPISDMIVNAEDEIAASSGATAVSSEGIKDRIALRLDRLEAALRRRAGRGVGILAIVGSSAPFVGLFGTVWGIMNAFIGIAESQTTNLAVVAPGIAEALLTTAIGLVAAIPAGIMYNIFARGLANYVGEAGDAGAAVMVLAGREIDRSQAQG